MPDVAVTPDICIMVSAPAVHDRLGVLGALGFTLSRDGYCSMNGITLIAKSVIQIHLYLTSVLLFHLLNRLRANAVILAVQSYPCPTLRLRHAAALDLPA